MNPTVSIPSLRALRKLCGQFKHTENEPKAQWKHIGPTHLRKVYGQQRTAGAWVYQPLFLKPKGEPRPTQEIVALIDDRPLDRIVSDLEDSFGQILARAHSGNVAAVRKFARIVCGAINALDHLSTIRTADVIRVAETLPRWPVLLSLNPQEIAHVKKQLRMIRVGTNSPTPTRPGQRLDPRNFWSDLAARAFEVCRANRSLVPVLKANCTGGRKERIKRTLWKTKISATTHRLPDGSAVVIPDWLERCGRLSEPVTGTNLKEWWNLVKFCVLDHWTMYPKEYAEALRMIGLAHESEWRRRSLALDRVEQAFRSLTRLR